MLKTDAHLPPSYLCICVKLAIYFYLIQLTDYIKKNQRFVALASFSSLRFLKIDANTIKNAATGGRTRDPTVQGPQLYHWTASYFVNIVTWFIYIYIGTGGGWRDEQDTWLAWFAGYIIFSFLIRNKNLKVVFLRHSNFKFIDSFF